MEKEKLESLIIDYIDNKLNPAERHEVEQELVKNPEAYTLYEQLKEVIHVMDRAAKLEPSEKLKTGFEEMLRKESASVKQTKTIFFQPAMYRVAAAVALLVIGGGIGYWISVQNTRQNAESERIAKIEAQLEETKNMMMAMIKNEQSASQRIQGVNVAMTIKKDDQVVNALIKAMNEDKNSNVRLAALEALSNFQQDPQVRKALIESLATQTDPVVQIALIQLMVKMKEKSVVDDLQRMVDDAETMKAVKDEAYTGILKLS